MRILILFFLFPALVWAQYVGGGFNVGTSNTLANPTFTPVSGTVNPGSVAITYPGISTGCYYVGVSAPSQGLTAGTCGASWTTYTISLTVSSTEIIWAYATQIGMTNSSSVSASYTVPTSTPQIFLSGAFTSVAAGSRFYGLSSVGSPTTAALHIPVSAAGTFRNLSVSCSAVLTGGSNAFSFMYSATTTPTTTALSVTINTTVSQASDTTDSIPVVAGGYMSMETVPTSASGTPTCSWSIEFDPTTLGQTMLTGWTASNLPTSATTNYGGALGDGITLIELTGTYFSPMAGTITLGSCYVYLNTAAGSGNQRAATLNQNGTGASSTLTWSNTSGVKNFTAGSLPISQGDYLDLVWVGTGTALTGSQAYWSCLFTPATPGQFPISTGPSANNSSVSVTNYQRLAGESAPSTGETLFQTMAPSNMTLIGFCAYANSTGLSGSSFYTLLLRENAANAPTTFSTPIIASDTVTCSNTSTYSPYNIPATYDLYDVAIVPTNTPATAVMNISWIGSTH